jgi:hypothetical protein
MFPSLPNAGRQTRKGGDNGAGGTDVGSDARARLRHPDRPATSDPPPSATTAAAHGIPIAPKIKAEVVFAGRIAEVGDGYVMVVQVKGTATMVPLWMAGAARRDRVGDLLALVADKLDGASAVVEAVPAIDIDDAPKADGFSPFGRGDARTRIITADDVRLLAGEPQSLRILVPVTIGG